MGPTLRQAAGRHQSSDNNSEANKKPKGGSVGVRREKDRHLGAHRWGRDS